MLKLIVVSFTSLLASAQITAPIIIGAPDSSLCGGNGFTACKVISFDHTKVGSSDSTNFPALVSGTYTYLRTIGNGGLVQNGSGFDVVFTSDAGCTTKLNWEVELWTAATGVVDYWVQVPTLSHTADTKIYECIGKSSITTDQSNKTATWNSNYTLVVHEPNGTSLTVADSTSNSWAINQSTIPPTAAVGKIDGTASFLGSSTQFWNTSLDTISNNAQALTASAWVNPTTLTDGQEILEKAKASGVSYLVGIGPINAGKLEACAYNGSWICADAASSVLTAGVWNFVTMTYDGVTLKLFVNASSVASTALGSINYTSPHIFMVGTYYNNGSFDHSLTGSIDEVNLQLATMTSDWILAEFNNQNSPSTFYTVTP